jgi:hypothetical protein
MLRAVAFADPAGRVRWDLEDGALMLGDQHNLPEGRTATTDSTTSRPC